MIFDVGTEDEAVSWLSSGLFTLLCNFELLGRMIYVYIWSRIEYDQVDTHAFRLQKENRRSVLPQRELRLSSLTKRFARENAERSSWFMIQRENT